MKTRIISIIISIAFAIALVSCENAKNDNSSEYPSNVWNPEVSQREILKEQGSMCGVLYMNYSYEEMEGINKDRKYYEKIFDDTGSIKNFPFLRDIPDSQIISTPQGTEIYLIIPCDPNAHVSIYPLEFDEETFEPKRGEETLYSSETGAPIVLQCNYSDLFSDAEIEITDSNGEKLIWRPFISLKDGSVNNQTENGKTILDFTEYDFTDRDVEE